jgi:hypothetical protein
MKKIMSKLLILCTLLLLSIHASSNEIIDVGIGATPGFEPLKYDSTSGLSAWKLSSSCIDINDNGQAACQALAVGPIYRCGFRGIRRCGSKVAHVYRWDGV